MKDIIIKGRYNTEHLLKYIEDNLYSLENCLYFRTILDNDNNIIAVDPDSGPFMQVGDNISNFIENSTDKIIESIEYKNKKTLIKLK